MRIEERIFGAVLCSLCCVCIYVWGGGARGKLLSLCCALLLLAAAVNSADCCYQQLCWFSWPEHTRKRKRQKDAGTAVDLTVPMEDYHECVRLVREYRQDHPIE